MRKKKVWRYYCDCCKKSGCHAGVIRKHEKYCTANPNRECRMCDLLEAKQKPLAELVTVFDGYINSSMSKDQNRDHDLRIERLSTLTEGCPACMLATARALDSRDPPISIDVDYKVRVIKLWANENANRIDEEYG